VFLLNKIIKKPINILFYKMDEINYSKIEEDFENFLFTLTPIVYKILNEIKLTIYNYQLIEDKNVVTKINDLIDKIWMKSPLYEGDQIPTFDDKNVKFGDSIDGMLTEQGLIKIFNVGKINRLKLYSKKESRLKKELRIIPMINIGMIVNWVNNLKKLFQILNYELNNGYDKILVTEIESLENFINLFYNMRNPDFLVKMYEMGWDDRKLFKYFIMRAIKNLSFYTKANFDTIRMWKYILKEKFSNDYSRLADIVLRYKKIIYFKIQNKFSNKISGNDIQFLKRIFEGIKKYNLIPGNFISKGKMTFFGFLNISQNCDFLIDNIIKAFEVIIKKNIYDFNITLGKYDTRNDLKTSGLFNNHFKELDKAKKLGEEPKAGFMRIPPKKNLLIKYIVEGYTDYIKHDDALGLIESRFAEMDRITEQYNAYSKAKRKGAKKIPRFDKKKAKIFFKEAPRAFNLIYLMYLKDKTEENKDYIQAVLDLFLKNISNIIRFITAGISRSDANKIINMFTNDTQGFKEMFLKKKYEEQHHKIFRILVRNGYEKQSTKILNQFNYATYVFRINLEDIIYMIDKYPKRLKYLIKRLQIYQDNGIYSYKTDDLEPFDTLNASIWKLIFVEDNVIIFKDFFNLYVANKKHTQNFVPFIESFVIWVLDKIKKIKDLKIKPKLGRGINDVPYLNLFYLFVGKYHGKRVEDWTRIQKTINRLIIAGKIKIVNFLLSITYTLERYDFTRNVFRSLSEGLFKYPFMKVYSEINTETKRGLINKLIMKYSDFKNKTFNAASKEEKTKRKIGILNLEKALFYVLKFKIELGYELMIPLFLRILGNSKPHEVNFKLIEKVYIGREFRKLINDGKFGVVTQTFLFDKYKKFNPNIRDKVSLKKKFDKIEDKTPEGIIRIRVKKYKEEKAKIESKIEIKKKEETKRKTRTKYNSKLIETILQKDDIVKFKDYYRYWGIPQDTTNRRRSKEYFLSLIRDTIDFLLALPFKIPNPPVRIVLFIYKKRQINKILEKLISDKLHGIHVNIDYMRKYTLIAFQSYAYDIAYEIYKILNKIGNFTPDEKNILRETAINAYISRKIELSRNDKKYFNKISSLFDDPFTDEGKLRKIGQKSERLLKKEKRSKKRLKKKMKKKKKKMKKKKKQFVKEGVKREKLESKFKEETSKLKKFSSKANFEDTTPHSRKLISFIPIVKENITPETIQEKFDKFKRIYYQEKLGLKGFTVLIEVLSNEFMVTIGLRTFEFIRPYLKFLVKIMTMLIIEYLKIFYKVKINPSGKKETKCFPINLINSFYSKIIQGGKCCKDAERLKYYAVIGFLSFYGDFSGYCPKVSIKAVRNMAFIILKTPQFKISKEALDIIFNKMKKSLSIQGIILLKEMQSQNQYLRKLSNKFLGITESEFIEEKKIDVEDLDVLEFEPEIEEYEESTEEEEEFDEPLDIIEEPESIKSPHLIFESTPEPDLPIIEEPEFEIKTIEQPPQIKEPIEFIKTQPIQSLFKDPFVWKNDFQTLSKKYKDYFQYIKITPSGTYRRFYIMAGDPTLVKKADESTILRSINLDLMGYNEVSWGVDKLKSEKISWLYTLKIKDYIERMKIPIKHLIFLEATFKSFYLRNLTLDRIDEIEKFSRYLGKDSVYYQSSIGEIIVKSNTFSNLNSLIYLTLLIATDKINSDEAFERYMVYFATLLNPMFVKNRVQLLYNPLLKKKIEDQLIRFKNLGEIKNIIPENIEYYKYILMEIMSITDLSNLSGNLINAVTARDFKGPVYFNITKSSLEEKIRKLEKSVSRAPVIDWEFEEELDEEMEGEIQSDDDEGFIEPLGKNMMTSVRLKSKKQRVFEKSLKGKTNDALRNEYQKYKRMKSKTLKRKLDEFENNLIFKMMYTEQVEKYRTWKDEVDMNEKKKSEKKKKLTKSEINLRNIKREK